MTEVRAHPRFSRVGFYNDIAIMVLDRPARKSKFVIPICLPKPSVVPSKERLAGRMHSKNLIYPKYSYAHIINVLKVVEPALSDGAQRIMEEKNQQFNEKPNFRFGEMKTAIEHIINQLPIISYALVTVKVNPNENKVFVCLQFHFSIRLCWRIVSSYF